MSLGPRSQEEAIAVIVGDIWEGQVGSFFMLTDCIGVVQLPAHCSAELLTFSVAFQEELRKCLASRYMSNSLTGPEQSYAGDLFHNREFRLLFRYWAGLPFSSSI